MSEQARILLVTPSDVQLQPSTERITASSLGDVERARSGPRPALLVQGSASGVVATDVLSDACSGHDGEAVLLLPLETYEWLRDVQVVPSRILALLPCVGQGVLMVVPERRLMELHQPPQDVNVREDLARFSRRELPIRLVASPRPVASAVQPFVPPRLCPAVRGKHAWIRPQLDKMWLKEIEGDTPAATTIRAGVAQMNDLLDESHNLAQSIEGHPDGDYWHAIMHRREPDYGNSKYWFRHVGRHPVFAQLAPRAAEILNDTPDDIRSRWGSRLKVDAGWDPFAFVDMCESAAGDEESALGVTARRIQWSEMLLLLRHCAQRAT